MNSLTKNVSLYGNGVSRQMLTGTGFCCEFCEITRNTFFYRTPPVAASGKSKNWLFPVYVNTKHDEPSREIYIQGKCMLARIIFSKALRFNITPKIDLFASRLNNQLPTCVLQTRSKCVRSRRILLRLE